MVTRLWSRNPANEKPFDEWATPVGFRLRARMRGGSKWSRSDNFGEALAHYGCRSKPRFRGHLLDCQLCRFQQGARRTRARAIQLAGVVPTCARKCRLSVLMLMAERRATAGSERSAEGFSSIHVRSWPMDVWSSTGGS